MHTTDWLDLAGELLPRRAKRLVAVLLTIGLVTGVGTPLFQWYVTTKASEITQDLMPTLEKLVTPPVAGPSARTP